MQLVNVNSLNISGDIIPEIHLKKGQYEVTTLISDTFRHKSVPNTHDHIKVELLHRMFGSSGHSRNQHRTFQMQISRNNTCPAFA